MKYKTFCIARHVTLALLLVFSVTGCSSDETRPAKGGAGAAGGAPTVTTAGPGEALVSWNAPTTRTDGAKLESSSIGGYKIHYGTASRSYDTMVDVGPVGTYKISDLTEGTRYFFAVTAYDISNRESRFSEEASKEL